MMSIISMLISRATYEQLFFTKNNKASSLNVGEIDFNLDIINFDINNVLMLLITNCIAIPKYSPK
jgi:hypothetical protein